MAGIHNAVLGMLSDVEVMSKDGQNETGWKYRSIEQMYDVLHPLLVKHKIFPTCEVVSQKREDKTSGGKTLTFSVVHVRYTLHAEDGTSISTDAVGEAADENDKSTGSALSIAYKYAFFQLLCIPVAPDPDARSPRKGGVTHANSTFAPAMADDRRPVAPSAPKPVEKPPEPPVDPKVKLREGLKASFEGLRKAPEAAKLTKAEEFIKAKHATGQLEDAEAETMLAEIETMRGQLASAVDAQRILLQHMEAADTPALVQGVIQDAAKAFQTGKIADWQYKQVVAAGAAKK